jgi:hypothetical protein
VASNINTTVLLSASHSMTYYCVPSAVGIISTPPPIETPLNMYELSSATSQAKKYRAHTAATNPQRKKMARMEENNLMQGKKRRASRKARKMEQYKDGVLLEQRDRCYTTRTS